MTIATNVLVTALNATAPLLNGRNRVCNSYYFTGERLITTDLDRVVSVPFATDFTCSIAPDKLLAFVKTLPKDGDVELIYDSEKFSLTIKCGKAKAKFAGTNDEMPYNEMLSKIEFKDFPVDSDKFLDTFHTVAKHVSHDETRRVLQGVYLCNDKGELVLTATDGRTLASASTGAIDGEIKANIMPDFVNLLRDQTITKYSTTDKFFAFQCASGNIYCGRMIEAEYPNYKQVIPVDPPNKMCLPENYELFLKRAMLVHESALFTFTETECTIKATNDNTEYVETFDVSSSAPVEFRFNLSYLMRVLEFSNVIFFTDGSGPVLCSTANSLAVAMPLRVS